MTGSGVTSGNDDRAIEGEGETRGSPTMGVAVISGATFANKAVTYYEVNGIAMVEGDISLGPVEDVQRLTDLGREAVATDAAIAFSVGVTGSQFRWPNCVVPYEIDPSLPNQQRVTDAIAHWEANTAIRFPLRTPANAAQYPNWVRFSDQGGCWSLVGMQGGQQPVSLGAECGTGNAIHEIGHTVGLWHEQSREDRDLFVTINWQNIQSGMAAQFNQHITDGDDLGAYDYGSIMHYPRTAFSKNGQETITPTTPGAQIGQRTGLSPGDIAGVKMMYPNCAIAKRPFEDVHIKIIEDPIPFKKVRDDGRFKKFRDDEIVIKAIRDPKLPRDPGPVKFARDTIELPGPETVVQPVRPGVPPGVLQPFAIATPHHAADPTAAAESDEMSYITALQRQVLDIDAAIAEARSTAAQANAEIARLEEASTAVAASYAQALDELGGGVS